MSHKKITAVFILFMIICCGCSQKMNSRSSTMFSTFDDFRQGPDGGVDLIWANEQITDYETLKKVLEAYDSILLDRIWVVVDEKSSSALTDEKVKGIIDYMTQEISSKLGMHFEIVDVPMKNTLRLSVAITNIKTPNPILAVTSTIVPFGLGFSTISKITTGEHRNVGKATIELLISDANTNKPIIAAIDRHAGNKDLGTMLDSLEDIRDAIDFWLDRLDKTFSKLS